jgi:DnaK suppressor protein
MNNPAQSIDATFIAQQRERLLHMQTELLRSSGEGPTLSGSGAAVPQKTTPNFADHRLGDIQRALQKIDEGTYGLSDESGEPIPLARLKAFPDALYTEREQEEQEQGK